MPVGKRACGPVTSPFINLVGLPALLGVACIFIGHKCVYTCVCMCVYVQVWPLDMLVGLLGIPVYILVCIGTYTHVNMLVAAVF